jgi:hypothetical protein
MYFRDGKIRYKNSYRTKFGDHRKAISEKRQKQIQQSYPRDLKRKRARYGQVVNFLYNFIYKYSP